MPDFHQLWAEKYLPRFHAQQARENEARDRAFLDLPYTVCGEPLRQLTARDLFILQGIENPFVCGGEIRPAHIAQLIWCQHTGNNPEQPLRSEFRKGRMIARLRDRNYDESVDEVNAFIDAMTLDLGGGKRTEGNDRRPLLTCFLAPLLVMLCDGMKSAVDPATGLPLIESPLPRLLQYRKVIEARAAGRDHKDYSPSDAMLVECCEEFNQLVAAEAAQASQGSN